jgi:hypothetical protein
MSASMVTVWDYGDSCFNLLLLFAERRIGSANMLLAGLAGDL